MDSIPYILRFYYHCSSFRSNIIIIITPVGNWKAEIKCVHDKSQINGCFLKIYYYGVFYVVWSAFHIFATIYKNTILQLFK